MARDPVSIAYDEYPYSASMYNPEERKKGKVFIGTCLNEHCQFNETKDKKLILCPECNHALFWSRK